MKNILMYTSSFCPYCAIAERLLSEKGFDVIEKIVDKFIDQLEAQLEEKKVTIELNKEAKFLLSEKGFDPVFGARPLARVIQEKIKKPLADKILFGELVNGGHIKITVKNDVFIFDVTEYEKAKEKIV